MLFNRDSKSRNRIFVQRGTSHQFLVNEITTVSSYNRLKFFDPLRCDHHKEFIFNNPTVIPFRFNNIEHYSFSR